MGWLFEGFQIVCTDYDYILGKRGIVFKRGHYIREDIIQGNTVSTFLPLIKPCICVFSITLAEQNEIKRRWQKQSIIISKIHSLGRILLLKQENQFFKKERSPVSYIHRGCKLIMKFQGKQGIPTLGSKELKRNADSWGPNGFRTEAKIGY